MPPTALDVLLHYQLSLANHQFLKLNTLNQVSLTASQTCNCNHFSTWGGLLISIRQHIEPKRLFSQSVLIPPNPHAFWEINICPLSLTASQTCNCNHFSTCVGGLLISIRQHIEPTRLFSQSVLNFMVELLQEGMEASDSAKPSRFLRNKYLPVASFCCVSEAVRSKTWKR